MDRIINNIFLSFVSSIIATIIGIIVFILVYLIGCYLFPPITSDGLHPLMPIGQIMFGVLIGTAFGIYFLVIIFIDLQKKYN